MLDFLNLEFRLNHAVFLGLPHAFNNCLILSLVSKKEKAISLKHYF